MRLKGRRWRRNDMKAQAAPRCASVLALRATGTIEACMAFVSALCLVSRRLTMPTVTTDAVVFRPNCGVPLPPVPWSRPPSRILSRSLAPGADITSTIRLIAAGLEKPREFCRTNLHFGNVQPAILLISANDQEACANHAQRKSEDAPGKS